MLQDVAILALATATVSVTVTQSRLFKPLRQWVEGHSAWLGDLISCSYCLGHWVAAGLVIASGTGTVGLLEGIIAWLAVTGGAALVSGTITKLYTGEETQ